MAAPLLITGTSGFLGHHLVERARARGISIVTAARSGADRELDLDDPGSLARSVVDSGCCAVLHAAAMARMGDCTADPEAAQRRNRDATDALATAGVPLLYVSTDLVFDGGDAPYAAADEARPCSVYGESKRGGELATLAAGGAVARVPLLFGPSFDGRRGATDMLRAAARDGRQLALFDNEIRTPLHAADAADLLLDCAGQLDALGGRVLHLAGPERISRYDFAERFVASRQLVGLRFERTTSTDPDRPRDVSLLPDRSASRSLDAMFAAS